MDSEREHEPAESPQLIEGEVDRSEQGEYDGLFAADEREDAERRWRDIQARFVDEPRTSVEQADELVAQLVDRLVAGFAAERSRLEAQWDRGDDVTTEDLRIALQRYRSFFGRLLDV